MAKRKQKIFRELDNPSVSSVPINRPAISLVIPMYNVKKYVAECLDSVLAQTFTDFEVIVVDDCSTDNSATIVKSYIPKFNGRLILSKTQKNSGGAGFPRNKGIELASGKYVCFLDPDDTISPTALDELFSLIEEFDADVASCENFYSIPEEHWNDVEYRKNLKPVIGRKNELVTEPVLLTENGVERVNLFHRGRFHLSVCLKIFRRNFIIENELKFQDCFAEDALFTMCALYSAGRYAVAPNNFYNYRIRAGSAMTNVKNVPQLFHRNIKSLKIGFRYLEKFFSDRDAFARNPELKYVLFGTFAEFMLTYFVYVYENVLVYKLDEFVREEFGKDDDNIALTAFMFNMLNFYRVRLIHEQAELSNEQLQRRLDELEKINNQHEAYISELENFIANSQQYIGELKDEIRQLKNKK